MTPPHTNHHHTQRLKEQDPSIEDLLPVAVENRNERRAKIRSLMDEVRNKGEAKEDLLEQAAKISDKWTKGSL